VVRSRNHEAKIKVIVEPRVSTLSLLVRFQAMKRASVRIHRRGIGPRRKSTPASRLHRLQKVTVALILLLAEAVAVEIAARPTFHKLFLNLEESWGTPARLYA